MRLSKWVSTTTTLPSTFPHHDSPQVGISANARASGLPGSGSYQTHGLAYGNTSSIPQPGPNNNNRVVSSNFVPSGQVGQQNLLSSGSYNPTVPENRATYVAQCRCWLNQTSPQEATTRLLSTCRQRQWQPTTSLPQYTPSRSTPNKKRAWLDLHASAGVFSVCSD